MRSYYCAQCRTIVSVDDTEAASVTCVSCGQLCTCTESEGDADPKANADFTADVAAISIADIPSLAIDLDVVNLPLSPDYAVEVEVTARHVSRILINGRDGSTLLNDLLSDNALHMFTNPPYG